MATGGASAAPAADQCASMLLVIVPRIMQALRVSIATLESPPLSVPQFRALYFLRARSGANLSATAEFLGLTLPSASKLIDHLVRRKLVARHSDSADRRRMTLRLTPKGESLLQGAQDLVRHQMAGTLGRFGITELMALRKALGILHESFPEPAACRTAAGSCNDEGRSDADFSADTAVRAG